MNYINNFIRYRFLLVELVKKGIKLKYRRSYLGILWSLLEPIMTTIVLTIVFGTLFAKKNEHFALYILCGRLLYTFFSTGTKKAVRCIRANAGMIKKVYVPKYLYPLSEILYNYIIFLISMIVLVLWGILEGQYPNVRWLLIILPLFILLVMTYGAGMILATVGVFFRDMEYLWDVALMIIMYTCAIFYYPDKILESGYAWVLNANPLYSLIAVMRQIVLGNPISWNRLAFAAAFSVGLVIVGTLVFIRKQDDFILHI